MNKAILMGRLARDPELRQTPQGTSVMRLTIAVDRRFRSQDGTRQADFISCTAWRQTAEFIARYFHKGDMIAVVGSIQTRTWDDQNNQRHYETDVVIDEAYFTGGRASGAQNAGDGYSQAGGYRAQQSAYQPQQYVSSSGRQPQSVGTSEPPQNAVSGFDDMDSFGFESLDGSEDDLPF